MFICSQTLLQQSSSLLLRIKWRSNIEIKVQSMVVRQPRSSKEEFTRRGDESYKNQVCPQVEEGSYDKTVTSDIETGVFEVEAPYNSGVSVRSR